MTLRSPYEAMDDIATFILVRPGRANAVTFTQVVRSLGLEDGRNEPQTRAVVKELTKARLLPFATCVRGVFLAQTDAEALTYVADLTNREVGIAGSRKAFLSAWKGWQ